MAGKMFDKDKVASCAQSSMDKSALKKQRNLTSKDIVQKLGDATKTGKWQGMLVYEVFNEGKRSRKRGRLYGLEDFGQGGKDDHLRGEGDQFLVDLFDISLSHRIVGIHWTDCSWAIRVYFEKSKDCQTNIDGDVVEAFKKMMEARG